MRTGSIAEIVMARDAAAPGRQTERTSDHKSHEAPLVVSCLATNSAVNLPPQITTVGCLNFPDMTPFLS
jgi:hypothetical protein